MDFGFGWDEEVINVANSLPTWNSQRNDIDDEGFLMSNSSQDIFVNPLIPASNINVLAADHTNLLKSPDYGLISTANAAMAAANQSTVVSLDQSLDCLLSATSSNTGTSSDDGISMIFPDSLNFWSFPSAAASSTFSSGDSENYKAPNNKDYFTTSPLNELDETAVSQTSSEYLNNGGIIQSQTTNSTSSKRSRNDDQSHEFKVGLNCGYFNLLHQNQPKPKKPRSEKRLSSSSNISFQQPTASSSCSMDDHQEPDTEAIAQMKEMIYRAAAFRPVNLLGLEQVMEKPKRKNVRISTDPQTVAARKRRERINERIRVLQRLVPGGTKMDTASMLDEAANYLKFLRFQVKALENLGCNNNNKIPPANFSSLPLFNSFPLLNYSNHVHKYPQS